MPARDEASSKAGFQFTSDGTPPQAKSDGNCRGRGPEVARALIVALRGEQAHSGRGVEASAVGRYSALCRPHPRTGATIRRATVLARERRRIVDSHSRVVRRQPRDGWKELRHPPCRGCACAEQHRARRV